LARDTSPPGTWMNGFTSYSMWWVLIQHDTWMHHGDRAYLESQRGYLAELMLRLASSIDAGGRETLADSRFLDWPTAGNTEAVHEGLQALLLMTLRAGENLLEVLGEEEARMACAVSISKMRPFRLGGPSSKQSAALMILAGLIDEKRGAAILKKDGATGLSTFFGYYVLDALAKAGEIHTPLDLIRHYWGAMLDFGATTFWEHFDLAWTENAARIDELVPDGKKDLHGDFGAHCYQGFRHSLCHGWAGGPTAWLSRQVLGIRPLAPGFTKVEIAPRLGDLKWAEGSYPTPFGEINARFESQGDRKIATKLSVPKGVEVQSKHGIQPTCH